MIMVICQLAAYLYRYWHHASRLLLVIERKKTSTLLRRHLIEKRTEQWPIWHIQSLIIMHLFSLKLLIRIYQCYPISYSMPRLRIILVSSENAASLKHDCKLLSGNSFTKSFLVSTNLSIQYNEKYVSRHQSGYPGTTVTIFGPLEYESRIDWHYPSTPTLSEFKRLVWPKLT